MADAAWRDGWFETQPLRGLRAMGRICAGWAMSQTWYPLRRATGRASLEDYLVAAWEGNFLRYGNLLEMRVAPAFQTMSRFKPRRCASAAASGAPTLRSASIARACAASSSASGCAVASCRSSTASPASEASRASRSR